MLLPTSLGDARALVAPAQGPVRATLVLGHGAGGGAGARDLAALAAALPGRGVTVVLLEQPWRVAGRRVAPAPATLDRAWLAAVPQLRVEGRLVLGGRSAGARVACRTAGALGAVGVVALAFPLHPPGSAGRTRLPELAGSGVPTLVVQGERDAFGGPSAFPPGTDLAPVPGADHGFAVRRCDPLSQDEALGMVVATVAQWLDGVLGDG